MRSAHTRGLAKALLLVFSRRDLSAPGGGGVLPYVLYVALTGTCGPIGYGFQGVLS